MFRTMYLCAAGVCLTAAAASAQDAGMPPDHDHGAMVAPAESQQHAPHEEPAATATGGDGRDASGTSWLPIDTPHHGAMFPVGSWTAMAHGQAFLQGIAGSGARGDRQAGSINWLMLSAARPAGIGTFTARAMLSLEPLTVGRCGYPDLLQSGERCDGEALHDRQHPHDLFMELAADYRRPIGGGLTLQLYGGPAAEPALGPTAYPHRPSAAPNPMSGIAHHWLDSSHIAFGVATVAVSSARWKAEGSFFNGREPDDDRYGFDLDPLDSVAGRLTWLPTPRWGFQASVGHLREAEAGDDGHDAADVVRITASATYHRSRGTLMRAVTLAWGRNHEGGVASHAALAEASLDVTDRWTVFGRAEVVGKGAHDLVLDDHGDTRFTVAKMQLGASRMLATGRGVSLDIGGSGAVARVPAALRGAYGGRRAWEGVVFLRLRSSGSPHAMAGTHTMPGHTMPGDHAMPGAQ